MDNEELILIESPENGMMVKYADGTETKIFTKDFCDFNPDTCYNFCKTQIPIPATFLNKYRSMTNKSNIRNSNRDNNNNLQIVTEDVGYAVVKDDVSIIGKYRLKIDEQPKTIMDNDKIVTTGGPSQEYNVDAIIPPGTKVHHFHHLITFDVFISNIRLHAERIYVKNPKINNFTRMETEIFNDAIIKKALDKHINDHTKIRKSFSESIGEFYIRNMDTE